MDYIDIAVIGPVSSGKSTLVNALLKNAFSKTAMRRTTMLPQVYVESNKPTDMKTINNKNDKYNLAAKKKQDAKTFVLADCTEIIYNVGELSLEKPADVKIRLFDIPGINDSSVQHIYLQYLANKLQTFTLVILILDVKSAINTQDEISLVREMKKMLPESKLVICANKCDYMAIKQNTMPEFENREIADCYEQMIKILSVELKDRQYTLVPISAEDAYIWRTLESGNTCLDIKFIDKIITNEYGAVKCRQWDEQKKREYIQKSLVDIDYTDKLHHCGYTYLANALKMTKSDIVQVKVAKVLKMIPHTIMYSV